MKKHFKSIFMLYFIFTFIFSIINVFAEDNKLSLNGVTVGDKSYNVGIEKLNVDNNSITNDMIFNEVGDYITYNVTIKNNSTSSYTIKSISDDNSNQYITYDYSNYKGTVIDPGSEKTLSIKVSYSKHAPSKVLNNNTVNFNILYEDESGILNNLNVNTGDHILGYVILFVLSIGGFILTLVYDKKHVSSYLALVLSVGILVPVTTRASSNNLVIKVNNDITRETVAYLDTGKNIIKKVAALDKVYNWVHNDYLNVDVLVDDNEESFMGDGITSIVYATDDQYIFVKSSLTDENNLISTDNSEFKIYMWFDTNKILLYSEADKLMMNPDSSYMFAFYSYIENLDLDRIISSNVNDMSYSFIGFSSSTDNCNFDLSGFDFSKVTNMNSMFLNAFYEVHSWSIGNVSDWDVSNVTDMSNMFDSAGYYSNSFNIILSNWDVGKVTNMNKMFYQSGYMSQSFSADLSNWDVGNVENMSYMFSDTGSNSTTFNMDLTKWDVSNVVDMSYMFCNTGMQSTSWYVGDLSNWDVSKVTNMNHLFSRAWIGFRMEDVPGEISFAEDAFIGDLSKWDVSSVKNMNSMFLGFNTSSENFDIGDISDWDVSSVTDMGYMFAEAGYRANTFHLNLSKWNLTNVNNTRFMFYYAGEYASEWSIGDLSNWNVGNVLNMNSMFAHSGNSASKWYIGNLSRWDVSNVTNMNSMFSGTGVNATEWNIGDLSNWNVSKVTDMSFMFNSAGENSINWSIGDLSNWDTNKVRNMTQMFYSAGENSTNWESIGTLNVWTNEVEKIFYNCSSAIVNLNIRTSIYINSNYREAFKNAATKDGSLITVNYKLPNNYIDSFINTKSDNSNVVKGSVIS